MKFGRSVHGERCQSEIERNTAGYEIGVTRDGGKQEDDEIA